jgi:dTMP kinase
MGLSIVVAGVALSLDAIMPNLLLAMLCTFVMGFFAGVVWVIGITLVGLEVSDDKRGRTFAFIYNMMRLMLLAVLVVAPFVAGAIGQHSAAIGGATLRLDGVTVTLFVAGIVAMVVGVVCLRMMDDRPDVSLRTDLAAAVRRRVPQLGRGQGGLFIAFEGGEGAGKSTQARRLAEALTARGYDVVLTFEPGATQLGREVRALLLDKNSTDMRPRTEAMLYAADRAQHVGEVIRPALERGAVVITDRYVDSSLAYQGAGRELDAAEVRHLSQWATDALSPDLTVLLDIDPEIGLRRATGPGDRLEDEALAFHQRVREAFLAIARHGRDRYLVIDVGRTDADEVHARLLDRVLTRLLDLPSSHSVLTMPLERVNP